MQTNTQELTATTLAIRGMTCGGCARTIERVVSRVPGVKNVKVDFDLGLAVVNGPASPSDLIGAVKATGYDASITDENAAKGAINGRRRTSCC